MASLESFQLPTLKQLIGHQSDSFSVYQNNKDRPVNANSLRRSFDVQDMVDIPIHDEEIIDDNNLLRLGLPQEKMNKRILHAVRRIQVIDTKTLEKDVTSELEEGANILTDELLMKKKKAQKGDQEIRTEKPLGLERSATTYGARANRRRSRIVPTLSTSTEGSSSIPSLPIAQTTQESISSQSSQNTTVQTTEASLPLNPRAADIERARRRRIRLSSSQIHRPVYHNHGSQVRRRPSRRRNKVDASESLEPTTTVRITTSRGSTLPSSTTRDFPRGFFLTKSIDEVLVSQMDNVTPVGTQSTDQSTVSTAEPLTSSEMSTSFSTTIEPFTLSAKDYSSTVTNSPLIRDEDQEGESYFSVTTTEIMQQNDEVSGNRYPGDFPNSMETTTEVPETTVAKLDDANYMDSSREIESVTESAALPHRYLRKKIRKIKPVSGDSGETPDSGPFSRTSVGGKKVVLKKINIRFSTEATPDSTSTNPESFTTSGFAFPPTTLEPTTLATSDSFSFLTSTISSTLDYGSISPTSETLFLDQPTTMENLTGEEDPDLRSAVTETSSDTPTEDILSRNEDSIKPNSNSLEFGTESPDSSTTISYDDLQPDKLEKLNFEFKNTSEIEDNNVATERVVNSTLSNLVLNQSTSHQVQDQSETSTFISSTIMSQPVLPEANNTFSIDNEKSTEKPMNTTKTEESIPRITKPTSNGRRRVLKRKRQRTEEAPEEKRMEVAKSEAIEVTVKKIEASSTTTPTTKSTNTLESEKPTRKRVVVYRGTRRFSSGTTPSTTVQSLLDPGDHQNQIAPRRRTKKVVRKRPKLPEAENPESGLSSLEDQSSTKSKGLLLDPEAKPLDDAEEAGSEVNAYRTPAATSRRPGFIYHREPSRFRGRATTYQPVTSTQPTSRRYASPGRQIARLEGTTQPPKLSFVSADDAAVLLEHLARLEDQRAEMDDQTNRAHEVGLEDPEATTEPGVSPVRTTFWRKISTTESPKTLATTAISASRRRQGQKYFNEIIPQNLPQRPRRPAIVDYDYYEDEEVRIVGRPILNGKLSITNRGSISCMDQGSFPHPTSCKKFIICTRMVNGLFVGTEYTCPDTLSFDPIGGICNWSAGIGCKE